VSGNQIILRIADLKPTPLHLALFFTGGMSLKTWNDTGLFDREVLPYRLLQSYGIKVTFVTYGDTRDLVYSDKLPGIKILCNQWGLPPHVYRRWLPVLHAPHLVHATILKTHQVPGADRALWSARLFNKKIVARCGYLISEIARQASGIASPEVMAARKKEGKLFSSADLTVVTTGAMQQIICERYQIPEKNVIVIPNYVDIDLFKPDCNKTKNHSPIRICTIGRFNKVKNLLALLDALKDLDIELLLIGDGEMRDELTEKVKVNQIRAQFLGTKPNSELPCFLNQSDIYIQPSLIEGHPKTLIEAMACGLPVIGSNVAGTREIIKDRQNGLLCGTSSNEIRAAITELMTNPGLMEQMGNQAREYVKSNFSLDIVLEKELSMLERLSGADFPSQARRRL